MRYQITLPAARGDIVDTNGAVLAQDTTVWDVSLCLPAPPGTELEETIKTLETLGLTAEGGEDVETQLAAFFAAASAGELPLAGGAEPGAGRRTVRRGAAAVRRGAPDGARRAHPAGRRAAAPRAGRHRGPSRRNSGRRTTTRCKKPGVAMNADIGQSGLEKVYDELLRGRSGTLLVHAGYDGNARRAAA